MHIEDRVSGKLENDGCISDRETKLLTYFRNINKQETLTFSGSGPWLVCSLTLIASSVPLFVGAKLLTLQQRLQLAMAQRRKEERARKAELNRLDNEDCGEEEEEEEDMTDESEVEEVRGCFFFSCCSGTIKLL